MSDNQWTAWFSTSNRTLFALSALGIVGIVGAGILQHNNVCFDGMWHALWILPAGFVFGVVPGIALCELSLRFIAYLCMKYDLPF